jgi:hypothetical protein
MRFILQCIGLFSVLLYVVTVPAYDIATHAAITDKAYQESILSRGGFNSEVQHMKFQI